MSAAARRAWAALVAAGLLLAGCTSTGETDGAPGAAGAVLWPARADSVAVLRQGTELLLTDGAAVAPLSIGDSRSRAVVDVSVAVVSPSSLALLTQGAHAAVHVVDLEDGTVHRRPCVDCQGVAAIGGRVVTVLADGTLVVLDQELDSASTVRLSGVEAPAYGTWEPDPDWSPDFRLLGAVGDALLVGRLAPEGGVRGGPTLVSRHSITGESAGEVSVFGRTERAVAGSDPDHVLIEADHSSGACSSGAVLHTLEGSAFRTEESEIIEDWSWTGDSLIAVSYSNQMTGVGCDQQSLQVHELTPDGEETDVVISPGITQLRALGACERVLAFRTVSGELPILQSADGSTVTNLGEYDGIVWSAPATARCDDLGGIVETFADA